MPRTTAEVRVSKAGMGGRPYAEVLVDGGITAENLASVLKNVTTNKDVFKAAGLRFCGGCKSGLDIWIRDRFEKTLEVEV